MVRRLAMVATVVLLSIVAPVHVNHAQAAQCAGEAQIAVVVDFGTGGSVSSVCVGAGARDNGATVLAARASQLRTAAPRFESSGLLCAIDGYPNQGCGDRTGDRYAFWSYWHGDCSGWTYSNVGPAGFRVQPGTVEGWRFQPAGAANPSDPPPRASPDTAAACQPAPPPATAPAAAPRSTMPPRAGSGGAVGGPTTTAGASAAGATTSTAVASTSPGATGSSPAAAVATSPLANDAATPVVVRNGGGGDGPPWGLIGGVGLVGAVGATGAVVARRRARLSS